MLVQAAGAGGGAGSRRAARDGWRGRARGVALRAAPGQRCSCPRFHGQFDAVALLVRPARAPRAVGRPARREPRCALAAAIGLKSFPVLLLPVVPPGDAGRACARPLRGPRHPARRGRRSCRSPGADAARCAASCSATAASPTSAGSASCAALRWLSTGVLPRSEAAHWAAVGDRGQGRVPAAYAALLGRWWRARPRTVAARRRAWLILLAFLVFYGALSAQYLLWVVPLGALLPSRAFAAVQRRGHGGARRRSTSSWLPAVLLPAPGRSARPPRAPCGRWRAVVRRSGAAGRASGGAGALRRETAAA